MTHLLDNQNLKALKLSLRWPDKSHTKVNYGVGSHGTCPNGKGLPIWKHLPLDKKLPYIPIPPGAAYITRGRAGKKLWSEEEAHDFRRIDSHRHFLYLPYDALHDSHLKHHISKRLVTQDLQRCQLLSQNCQALCSLKALNHFRQVKRMLNLESVHHKIQMEEEALKEKRQLEQIEEELKKKKEKWDLEQKLEEAMAGWKSLTAEKEENKREREKQKEKRKIEYLKCFEAKNALSLQEKKNKSLAKLRKVEKNLDSLHASQRTWLLKLRRKIKERYQRLAERQNLELLEKEKNRHEKIEREWNRKITAMNKEDALAQTVLKNALKAHECNVQRRKQKAADIKKQQEAVVQKFRQHRTEKRAQVLRKLWTERINKSQLSSWCKPNIQEECMVLKSVVNSLQDYNVNKGPNNYLANMKCFEPVHRLKEMPLPVTYMIDYCIEEAIGIWTRKYLKLIVSIAKEVVLDYGTKIFDELKSSRTKKPQVPEFQRQGWVDGIIIRQDGKKAITRQGGKENQARGSYMETYLLKEDSVRGSKPLNIEKIPKAQGTASVIDTENEKRSASIASSSKTNNNISSKMIAQNGEESSKGSIATKAPGSSIKVSLPTVAFLEKTDKFGKVEEFYVLEFPDFLRSVKGRRMTPVPSFADLTRLAWQDPPIAQHASQDNKFPEQSDLRKTCKQVMVKVVQLAKTMMTECIEPTTRMRTVKKLARVEGHASDSLVEALSKNILGNEKKKERDRRTDEPTAEETAAMGITKSAVSILLNPIEFRRKTSGFVTRYRIMFTAPKTGTD